MKNERYDIFWYNIYAWQPIIIFKNMANKNAHRQDYGQKLTLYIEIYILLQMWYYNTRHIRNRKCQLNIINYQRGGKAMKFFRKLGFQLVLFFVVAITIPIVMLMVSSITTTSSSMENNMKVTSEQTLNEAQNQFTTYLKTLSQPVDLLTRKNEVKHLEDQGTLSDNVKAVRDSLIASVKVTNCLLYTSPSPRD